MWCALNFFAHLKRKFKMKREIHLHQNRSFDACLFAFICQLSLLFLVNVVKIEKLQTRRQTLENYVLLLTVCISFETCTIKILCCFKIVHFYPVCCSLETAVFELFIRNNFFRSLHLENRETIFFLSWISSGNKAQKNVWSNALSAQVDLNCKFVVDRTHIVAIGIQWLNLFTVLFSYFIFHKMITLFDESALIRILFEFCIDMLKVQNSLNSQIESKCWFN